MTDKQRQPRKPDLIAISERVRLLSLDDKIKLREQLTKMIDDNVKEKLTSINEEKAKLDEILKQK